MVVCHQQLAEGIDDVGNMRLMIKYTDAYITNYCSYMTLVRLVIKKTM